MKKPRVIAFYLPQFHPIPENDKWWGKGFTEWFNVGKAKKLYIGHVQPKVPTELGYYDLRLKNVRERQAELAREAGVEGFCYWHYWFGNGRRLLDLPINEVVRDKKPDFPFCLGWANHSWEKKTWSDEGDSELLIKQEYGGEEDDISHFNAILPILKDERYIMVDGKPLFLVFDPTDIPHCKDFISLWQKLAIKNGLKGIHFVAQAQPLDNDYTQYYMQGFDAVCSNRISQASVTQKHFKRNKLVALKYLMCKFFKIPKMVHYKFVMKEALCKMDEAETVYPQIVCGWDHTPRSGRNGVVFTHFTPALLKKHALEICKETARKTEEHQIIFLKSWNEWGEGNFMEPDLEYGTEKIRALSEAVQEYSESSFCEVLRECQKEEHGTV